MPVLPILLLCFIVVPIAELAVIIQVGQEIGILWTVGILLVDSIVGSLLLRAQGRATWRRFTTTLQAGRPPAREVLDGALVLVGGALLLTPGFITDIVGICLLLPPTRAIVRRLLGRRLLDRMVVGMVGGRGGPAGRSWPPGAADGPAGRSWPPGRAGADGPTGPTWPPRAGGPDRGAARPRPSAPDDIDGTTVDADPPSGPAR